MKFHKYRQKSCQTTKILLICLFILLRYSTFVAHYTLSAYFGVQLRNQILTKF